MSSLPTLPPEIFRQILALVPRAQLTHCALVSKTWCEHAILILYEHIDLTWRRPEVFCEQSWDNLQIDLCPCVKLGFCKPDHHLEDRATRRHRCIMYNCLMKTSCVDESWPSLYLLARTLVSSPSLARLIYRFRLAGSVPRSIWTDPDRTALSDEDLNHISTILRCDSQMSRSRWLRRLEHGCPSAFAALVLMCLSELQSFHLSPYFQDALAILGAPLLNQRLSLVRRASIGIFEQPVLMGSGRPPYPQADNFFQLLSLRLPQIQSLALNLPRPLTPFWWLEIRPGQLMTSIETLELTYTFLDEHDLVHLLRACPRLRTLKYDYWTTSPSRDPYVNGAAQYTPDQSSERLVDTQVLGKALQVVRETLVCLHLHIIPPFDWFNQYLQSLDFTAFDVLTTLHVPLQLLTNKTSSYALAQSLPFSLEHLWLNDDGAYLWLNHQHFRSPRQHYYFEDNVNPVYDPAWHPIHTDEDIICVISSFLSDWRNHVPHLKSLRLILYTIDWPCWAERDEVLIRTNLLSVGERAGVEIFVHKVHERREPRWRRKGHDPPYFTLDAIRESRLPEVNSPCSDTDTEAPSSSSNTVIDDP